MLPNVETALAELELAGQLNPGPWTKHSENVGLAARNIAERVLGMDPERAHVLGLLHDIGRRVGVVGIPRHIVEGYRYAMERGWDEAARVCMTHSYPLMAGEWGREPECPDESLIKDYILSCEADSYDRLIQLCDGLAVDYGFCILEKRLVDVVRRYGIEDNTLDRWNAFFAIKEGFEAQMGCSVYDVLPDVGRTTLLCPPPWKPKKAE